MARKSQSRSPAPLVTHADTDLSEVSFAGSPLRITRNINGLNWLFLQDLVAALHYRSPAFNMMRNWQAAGCDLTAHVMKLSVPSGSKNRVTALFINEDGINELCARIDRPRVRMLKHWLDSGGMQGVDSAALPPPPTQSKGASGSAKSYCNQLAIVICLYLTSEEKDDFAQHLDAFVHRITTRRDCQGLVAAAKDPFTPQAVAAVGSDVPNKTAYRANLRTRIDADLRRAHCEQLAALIAHYLTPEEMAEFVQHLDEFVHRITSQRPCNDLSAAAAGLRVMNRLTTGA